MQMSIRSQRLLLSLKVAADTDHNFVYVTSKSDANAYLKVDTAANGVGIQFLKFGWTDMAKEKRF